MCAKDHVTSISWTFHNTGKKLGLKGTGHIDGMFDYMCEAVSFLVPHTWPPGLYRRSDYTKEWKFIVKE